MISNDLFREDPDFWIRLVERNIPTRLFDKGTTSEDVILKRLKLSSSSQIAIQPSERKLKPNEVVITIVMHIPGTRCYGEEMELVTDVPASKLAYQLSEYLNVPVRHVIVAVKMLDKYEWAVIPTDHASESPTKKTNKSVSKKGKKNTLKKKLSKSPKESIQIKHGDLIGVKIIPEEDASSFQLYLSDFDTEDDILMRKKLKELREKSQDLQRSQNDSFENEDHFEDTVETSSPVVSTNNEERSLKIHVDNFSQSSDLNVSLS
uniref:Uncharacterized protein n=1 Tax=Ciona savignyi TaxID=51511 RepID=H2Z539_CIOSA